MTGRKALNAKIITNNLRRRRRSNQSLKKEPILKRTQINLILMKLRLVTVSQMKMSRSKP
jgi:hypothetical protein